MIDASGLTEQRHDWERTQEIRRVEYLRRQGRPDWRIADVLTEESVEDDRRSRERRIAGQE